MEGKRLIKEIVTVSEKAFHGVCLLEPVGNPERVSRGWNLYERGRKPAEPRFKGSARVEVSARVCWILIPTGAEPLSEVQSVAIH